MSEWTFGGTISSDFTLRTWLEDIAMPSEIDAKLWERQRILQDEASQMMSPLWSPSTQHSRVGTIRTDDEGTMGKKLLTSSLEPKTTYSGEELKLPKETSQGKEACMPTYLSRVGFSESLHRVDKEHCRQTEEHKKESNRIDQLIQEYGPIKASLDYAKERETR